MSSNKVGFLFFFTGFPIPFEKIVKDDVKIQRHNRFFAAPALEFSRSKPEKNSTVNVCSERTNQWSCLTLFFSIRCSNFRIYIRMGSSCCFVDCVMVAQNARNIEIIWRSVCVWIFHVFIYSSFGMKMSYLKKFPVTWGPIFSTVFMADQQCLGSMGFCADSGDLVWINFSFYILESSPLFTP